MIVWSESMTIKHVSFSEIVDSKVYPDSLFIFYCEPEPLEVCCGVTVRFDIKIVVGVIL